MSRDPRVPLDDVVRYANDAIAFVGGMSFEAFAADERTHRAVLYSLLVVGEAAKRVPGEVRDRAPGVRWREAMSFRNRAAHGYDSINLVRVWGIVTQELPPFRDGVAALLATLDAEDPPLR